MKMVKRLIMSRSVPWIFLSISLVLSILTFWVLWSVSQRRLADEFDKRGLDIRFAIIQRMSAYEQLLWGGVGFIKASAEVNRHEWQTYLESQRVHERYPGLQGVGFSLVVPRDRLEKHEAAVRAEGFEQYRVWPESTQTLRTAILYLEPFDWRNRRAFGYDMYSEPVRREAMRRAAVTGKAATSGRVTLVQETDTDIQAGFLMYLPVYRRGVPLGAETERMRAINGFVYSPFRMNDLMRGIMGGNQLLERIQIYDEGVARTENLLYDSLLGGGLDEREYEPGTELSFPLNVEGRDWLIKMQSTAEFDRRFDWELPVLGGALGVAVSLLLFFLLLFLRRIGLHAASLNEANRKLLSAIKSAGRNADEARRANRHKSEFIAHVSHELRTPLNGVIGMAELVSRTPLNVEQQEMIEDIRRSGSLLISIINNILDMAKVEAGKLELCAAPFRLDRLIHDVDRIIRWQARAAELVFETSLMPDEAVAVCGDSLRLQQILVNLLGNAIKFTDTGCVMLRVVRIGEDEQTATWRFAVSDTGPGICEEDRERLFQEFEQLDSSEGHSQGGTGLGLAISRQLVALMGGTLEVDSTVGEGSIFSFVLRLPRVDACVADAQANSPELLRWRRTPHILMAEDNPINQKVQVGHLEHLGCRVDVAGSGTESLERYEKQEYDLVFMDINMPGMDGRQTAAEMLNWSETRGRVAPPIIALSAHAFKRDVDKAENLGFHDFLSKPFVAEQLRAILRQWLPELLITEAVDRGRDSEKEDNSAWAHELSDLVPVDVEALLKTLGLMPDKAHDIVRAFIGQTGEMMTLRDLREAEQFKAMVHLAHSAKSAAGFLQRDRLKALLDQLEAACEQEDRRQIDALIPQVLDECAAAADYMQHEILPRLHG
jgi:signal transduction histidine kinase/CheY-like chemotaxis protein/HPt (histidine-containing phosphotransfer) domain-containing protein